MLFRGSGFRRSQKKVCKGHRHGALWGSMRPSRPPRWLVQIPRLSGGLCFLARKSSLASNDPSHGTLMPTRTLSWGSSILIKGGKTPPLGIVLPRQKGGPSPGRNGPNRPSWAGRVLQGHFASRPKAHPSFFARNRAPKMDTPMGFK